MHLALIIDDYLPNSTRSGARMFHELALALKLINVKVTVICPNTDSYKEYVYDGIDVISFKSGKIKDTNLYSRFFNELLLSIRAIYSLNFQYKKSLKFDGIVHYSPSIFFSFLVKFLKKQNSCRSYLILRDVFPQWSVDEGIISKNSISYLVLRYFEKYLYIQHDKIGLMSEKNMEIFQQRNPNHECEVLRNWSSSNYYERLIKDKVKTDNITFFYGGNIGKAQDIDILIDLVIEMKKYKNLKFVFVGQGDSVDTLLKAKEKFILENLDYKTSVNQETYNNLLSDADVGIFSLSSLHTYHNFPGKVFGYMSLGKPILGIVNPGNDFADMINVNKAGFVFYKKDKHSFLKYAEMLYKNSILRDEMGKNSYNLLVTKFSDQSAANQVVSYFLK